MLDRADDGGGGEATASSFVHTARWIEHGLTGSIGTSVAILSVAAVGLMLLRGTVPIRRGVTVILGCFILFSAQEIAAGLAGIAASQAEPVAPVAQGTLPPPPARPQVPYDPYAGAAVLPAAPRDGDLLPK